MIPSNKCWCCCGVELHNRNDVVEQDAAAVGHLLPMMMRFAYCWAQHLVVVVVAAVQLSLSYSTLTLGSSLLCLRNLMTNDEPEGGLLMTTDGPADDLAGDAVAEADAAAVLVVMVADVSDVHLGWTMPDGKKNSRKTAG